MKKQVNVKVFDILKSLVDNQVPALKHDASRGVDAGAKISDLWGRIDSLHNYIIANRYDRADVREAESEINDYEREISDLQRAAARFNNAQSELKAAAKFYHTYNAIAKNAHIDALQREYDMLDARADKLSDLIFACQVNIDPDNRDAATCAQYSNDITGYREEYSQTIARLQQVARKIKSLSH